MREKFEWTYKKPRSADSRRAWGSAVASIRRSLLIAIPLSAFIALIATAVSPEVDLPFLNFAVVTLLVPCFLLLAPLLEFISPNTRYRITPSGIVINGRGFKWHHAIELANSPSPQTLVVTHRAGAIYEVHLPDPPYREEVLAAIHRWSGLELRSCASATAVEFSSGTVILLMIAAAANALIAGAMFGMVPPASRTVAVGPFLLLASLPSALFGALQARIHFRRFTRLPLVLGYVTLLVSSGMSAIFVLAFLVKSRAIP